MADTKKLKILQIAPIEEPVPARKYGGIEQVVYNVTEELVRQGHEVYLMATGDSVTSARIIPIVPKSLREMYAGPDLNKWRDFYKMYYMGRVLKNIAWIKPDVIHQHLNWRFAMFSDLVTTPVITTVHGAITTMEEIASYSLFPNSNYVSISNNQRKALPNLNWVKTIYNGIDLSTYEYSDKKGDYFAFLGRTSPEKGLAEIVRVIKKSPYKLKIAAKVDNVDKAYFEKEVKPFIDGRQIEFLGEVDMEGKNKLLKNAKGLLLWLNWEEPFGLVMVEAMATGTPVIVTSRGSAPELIKNGKTGFLVKSVDEMEKRLSDVDKIKPADCRTHVYQYFSREKMAADYTGLMERLVNKTSLRPPKYFMSSQNYIEYAHEVVFRKKKKIKKTAV